MRDTATPRIYAETLLQVAQDEGRVDAIADEAEAMRAVLRDTPKLSAFLESPRIGRETKKAVLRAALEGRVSETTVHFLEVVIERDRIELLEPILAELSALVGELRNEQRVVVTSAVPLTQALREQLRSTLARATGRGIVLRERIDPSLMAGVVVQVGDTLIDGSVRTRLQNLRERLLAASRAGAAAGG